VRYLYPLPDLNQNLKKTGDIRKMSFLTNEIVCQLKGEKMDKKVISEEVIEKLEKGKKEVLKRIAKSLKEQKAGEGNYDASHSSHSSGGGRTHGSHVTH
jgi:predicted phage-related endonuclease